MKKLFYGLQMIYQQQVNVPEGQRQKMVSTSLDAITFILPHHLLKRLDGLDYRQALLVGGHPGSHECLGRNESNLVVQFPSGGAGFLLQHENSWKIMQPHLTSYVEHDWPQASDVSDVALTCLAARLGVTLTREVGFWAHPPAFTLKEEGHARFHAEPEPNNFHYITPDEMYALDEFYVNQHMDRD